ncbi:MAG: hypothetical protein V4529_12025 [Gemmatimonadota bacterium]
MAHADREADGSTHKPIADLTDPLRGELVALAGRLTRQGIILTVGGGYGLVLKLHPLGEQVNNPARSYGSNHAFDIYTTIALVTEPEWDEMMNLRDQYAGTTSVARARELRTELFGELPSLGFIRMREYAVAAGIHINPERFGDIREDLRAILEA